MAYKVDYYTLALMKDGSLGNIKMENGHIYTDNNIETIPKLLDGFLKVKKRVGVIASIKDVGGTCVDYNKF